MKIQRITTDFVRLPVEEPLVGAPPMPTMLRDFITVQMRTDDGIEGIGVTTFGGRLVKTLKTAVEEFGADLGPSDRQIAPEAEALNDDAVPHRQQPDQALAQHQC